MENYPKEGSLPAKTKEYVHSDHQKDNFYERFMEQCTRGLNNPSTSEEHDSFPFLIEPSRSISSNPQNRRSTRSNDSGITSPLASFRTPELSPATSIETSTPRPSTSQYAQVVQPSPKGYFRPIQQFFHKSAKMRFEEPKYNRSPPHQPNLQSVLRTQTRQGY